METCCICKNEIVGSVVIVSREHIDTGEKVFFKMDWDCFEKEFTSKIRGIIGGDKVEFGKPGDIKHVGETAESAENREARAERYKRLGLEDIKKAQAEKNGNVFLHMVNDPSSYWAAREMMSLKGIDMSVEQFEELAAIFIHLTRKAILKSAERTEQKR